MSGACDIDVRFFRPPPPLDGCFTSFYRLNVTVRDGDYVEDWLQPEWSNVRFFRDNKPEAMVPDKGMISGAAFTATGPTSLPIRFRLRTTRCWGIGLFPLGWAKFALCDASQMANELVDGEASPAFGNIAPLASKIFDGPEDDEAEYARIIEHFLGLHQPHRDSERIRSVHAALVNPEVSNVTEFAQASGVAARSLERLCRRYFGFSPKLLLRRQRFMRSLADWMIKGGRWTDALDGHYHDQSQFTREFRRFMTMTPSEYAGQEHPVLGAFMVERARVWGSAAQTLDRPDL